MSSAAALWLASLHASSLSVVVVDAGVPANARRL